MTFARFLRIWRELNAISISDISKELNLPYNKVRNFDINPSNEIIYNWYLSHGLNMEEYNNVKEKYEQKFKTKN